MKIETLVIVGVGLIGGSIGLAVRQRKLAKHVIGVGRVVESLQKAQSIGAIDEFSLDLENAASRADFLVFCTPVNIIPRQILTVLKHCKPGATITDAGSTKSAIIAAIKPYMSNHVAFVGSHPLAGSEKKGPENADATLFQDRLTIVTPHDGNDPKDIEKVCKFWEAIGSKVHLMDAAEHDQALAMTSHLPHLLAATLASVLPEPLSPFTATGFRDTTRIAAGDPTIWTGIFQQNRTAMVHSLEVFKRQLQTFQDALENNDTTTLNSLLTQAKKVRDALGS